MPKPNRATYRLTLKLPDGRVIRDANHTQVQIEDELPGIRTRLLESLVGDADEFNGVRTQTAKTTRNLSPL